MIGTMDEYPVPPENDYVAVAAERLLTENVPLSQVKACIRNFAPEAAYDAAYKELDYSYSYVDNVIEEVQQHMRESAKTNSNAR